MNSLFVCNTSFQIMSAILLSKSNSFGDDIVVVNSFGTARDVAKRLGNENAFRNVFFVDETKIWRRNEKLIKKRISTIKTYINLDNIIESICPNIMEYSDLYVANRAAINRLFCMYVAKHNPKCSIHYFDDGIGTYDGTVVDVKAMDKLLRRVLVGKKAARYKYDTILYSPDLYKQIYPNRKIVVHKMPIPQKCEILDSVFDVHVNDTFDARTIIFDIKADLELDEVGYKNYLNTINTICGMTECIIKPHPGASKKYFDGMKYFENKTAPFEVFCYKNNFENSILVTNFSSAVITPKLLFGQEPYIVFLYKLNQSHRRNGIPYDDEIIRLFSNHYVHKEKIIVPSTIEELKDSLKQIL